MFEYSEDPLGDILRTSWGRLKSTSQGSPMDVISGRPQDISLGRHQNVRLGRSGTVKQNLQGTSWGCQRETSLGRPGDQYLPTGTKTDATVSNTYQIQLKKVFAATKIQKPLPQAFCKRRSTTLLKKAPVVQNF